MKRRDFLAGIPAGAAGVAAGWGGTARASGRPGQAPSKSELDKREAIEGFDLQAVAKACRRDLFERFLPFWEAHGIDHENGGFMCGMDHDGRYVNTDKYHWFQGRGVWIYSRLYNRFERRPEWLDTARKTRDFLLRHAVQPDGWWAELLARDGRVLVPFKGDIYGMLFAAEGLAEYAEATGRSEDFDRAVALVKQVFKFITRPNYVPPGGPPGVRGQGLWMITLQVVTQLLRRSTDPELAEIAERCVDAVVVRHFQPEIGLNTEYLDMDFKRPAGEEVKSNLGHGLEAYWFIMEEAKRLKDRALFDLAVERARRHFEVAWDFVYGGLANWINVGRGGYEWPAEQPVFTGQEFKDVGEYHYMKSLWSHDEALIAMLKTLQDRPAPWAERYFDLGWRVIDEKFSGASRGRALWTAFMDRKFTDQPHVARQENYHHPRLLIFVLEAAKGASLAK
jgi:N-acylglucosamine 2-epimerase